MQLHGDGVQGVDVGLGGHGEHGWPKKNDKKAQKVW